MSTPSVTIIGPGAIGCAVAAALFDAGHQPTLIGRTPFSKISVNHPDGSAHADVQVLTEVEQIEPTDVVFVATKANQMSAVGESLRAATAEGAIVVVAQNGLDHAQRVEPFVPATAVIVPAVVFLPAHRSGPGVVEITGASSLIVPAGRAADILAELFEGSFLSIQPSDDWLTEGWKKLIINAGLGAVGVLVRKNNASTIADAAGHDLLRRIMAEIVPVARAEGAHIDEDFPETILEVVSKRGGNHMSSIVVDRINGLATEWRERNEYIGTTGRRHGLPTPLNDLCTTLIRLGEPDD